MAHALALHLLIRRMVPHLHQLQARWDFMQAAGSHLFLLVLRLSTEQRRLLGRLLLLSLPDVLPGCRYLAHDGIHLLQGCGRATTQLGMCHSLLQADAQDSQPRGKSGHVALSMKRITISGAVLAIPGCRTFMDDHELARLRAGSCTLLLISAISHHKGAHRGDKSMIVEAAG